MWCGLGGGGEGVSRGSLTRRGEEPVDDVDPDLSVRMALLLVFVESAIFST